MDLTDDISELSTAERTRNDALVNTRVHVETELLVSLAATRPTVTVSDLAPTPLYAGIAATVAKADHLALCVARRNSQFGSDLIKQSHQVRFVCTCAGGGNHARIES